MPGFPVHFVEQEGVGNAGFPGIPGNSEKPLSRCLRWVRAGGGSASFGYGREKTLGCRDPLCRGFRPAGSGVLSILRARSTSGPRRA